MQSMLTRCRRSHTALAAYTALFLALGGTAYAAATITSEDIVDETIQTQDIAAQAVQTADIGKQAVTLDRMHDYSVNSAKVVDNSLTSADIANGSLNSWDIGDGSLTGSDIADDAVKAADLDLSTVSATTDNEWHPVKTKYVYCGAGKKAIGGGGEISGAPHGKVAITESVPAGSEWRVTAELVKYPPVPEWQFSYDGDYVTGYEWWSQIDDYSYVGEWTLKVWAVCV